MVRIGEEKEKMSITYRDLVEEVKKLTSENIELLEACREALELIEYGSKIIPVFKIKDHLRQAINKAEGKGE